MLPLDKVFQDKLKAINGKKRNWINVIFCVIGCQSLYAYVHMHAYICIHLCMLFTHMNV